VSLFKDNVLHCKGYCGLVNFSYHSMVLDRLQPQSLCVIVNQLDTARRFMLNKVTSAKCSVVPSSIESILKEIRNGLLCRN